MIKFQIVENPAVLQPWHVRIVGSNGEILAVTETFVERSTADEAVERLQTADLANAEIEVTTLEVAPVEGLPPSPPRPAD